MTEGFEQASVETMANEPSASQYLDCEAARTLDEALATTLHLPGQRDRYRRLLRRAISRAEGALTAAEQERAALGEHELAARDRLMATTATSHCTLLRAHAALAEDALHGAGQLSLSAQRAPTRQACEEGWRRVDAIVAGAEASARVASSVLAELDSSAPSAKLARLARAAAHKTAEAALRARRIIDERNHAYTFHTDNGFSFGEGWYLAAAAVLAGVSVQIEPGKPGTPQAEAFLRDAGVGRQLQAYRSRPRAMKQVTAIVARAFDADPLSAQQRLRAAFLGDLPTPSAVTNWLDNRLAEIPADGKKVLLWIRDGVHHDHRNTPLAELVELIVLVRQSGLVPVLIGDALLDAQVPDGAVDLILFWKDPTFQKLDMRRAQLQFFEHLKVSHSLVGQIGVTTAGMDGPALLGLPTMYLTDVPNVRMGEWVGTVPQYHEVLRSDGYLERIRGRLAEWAATGQRTS